MRLAFGTDEDSDVTAGIVASLRSKGHDVVTIDTTAWPDVGRTVGETVARGEAERGIVCCWTGTGVSIAANKVGGVRAALCPDAETARGARRWNDANVLALSLRLTTSAVGEEIVDAFLSTGVDPSEEEQIAKLS